jgi:hypothetical protein
MEVSTLRKTERHINMKPLYGLNISTTTHTFTWTIPLAPWSSTYLLVIRISTLYVKAAQGELEGVNQIYDTVEPEHELESL